MVAGPSPCFAVHPVNFRFPDICWGIAPDFLRTVTKLRGDKMKEIQTHLENLHAQIVDCEMIRDGATDPRKRELFGRLAEHHKVLAAELEGSIAGSTKPRR